MRRNLLRLVLIVLLGIFAVEPVAATTSAFFAPRIRRAQYGWGRPYRHRRHDWRLDARWRALLFRQAQERRACRYYRRSYGCANLRWRQHEERLRLQRLLHYGYRW